MRKSLTLFLICILVLMIPSCRRTPSSNNIQAHEEIPVLDSFKSQWSEEKVNRLQTRITEVLQKEFGVSGHLAELRFQYTATDGDVSKLQQMGVASAQSRDQYCCGTVCRCCPLECKPKCYKW